MKQKKQNALSVLLGYAGSHRRLTLLGLGLSAVSMVCSMIPYLCIWLAARDLIAVAPDWTQARSVTDYGWIAFAFAVGGILIYFLGLMCTHLAAFRTAANIRKQGMAHVMQAPLGYFDANASGLIRSRLDAAAADTETLLAHNLADIVGTITLFLAMLVLMFVFDWRMGAACLLALGIGIQNLPEGTAVSVPLRREGMSRGRAFFLGQASGIVEPIAGVLGVLAAGTITGVMPWLLAFAAGAMIYVVVEELIPEASLGEHSHTGTLSVMLGFLVMMVLDVALG